MFMQAEDRLLQISDRPLAIGDSNFASEGLSEAAVGSSDLAVHHLKPPSSYVAANWPLQHAAMSPDGVDIAVAGRRGLALYSRRSARWRLFGDVSHEKGLAVHVNPLTFNQFQLPCLYQPTCISSHWSTAPNPHIRVRVFG